jgi:hypothetical protein
MVPSVAATAAIGVAMSQGALAASFSVSGQQFKVSAKDIQAEGFMQYGAVDSTKKGTKPVAVVGMNHASITDLCQSVVVPVPVFGDVSMILGAGGNGTPVEAKKLYIDATDLSTNAEFTNIDIGVSVDDTSTDKGIPAPSKGDKDLPGSFAHQAESVHFTDVKQTAWATTAGTFKLSGLHMSVKKGKHECF